MSDRTPPASYPASSSPAGGGAPVAPPQQVNIAFWLYIVGAALIVAGTAAVLRPRR